jgi:superfamily II DNA/RNA helicase
MFQQRHFEHYPSFGGKAVFLMKYCDEHPKTVFMFRYLRLLEAFDTEFRKSGVPTAKLHGEMFDRQRDKALHEFRSGGTNVLLMTRDTGKRGLDLPQALAAVFYSPKASESSTFQEASLIRSTTSQVKECRILYYGKTDERGKLQRLVEQILSRIDRKYTIVDPQGLCTVREK